MKTISYHRNSAPYFEKLKMGTRRKAKAYWHGLASLSLRIGAGWSHEREQQTSYVGSDGVRADFIYFACHQAIQRLPRIQLSKQNP